MKTPADLLREKYIQKLKPSSTESMVDSITQIRSGRQSFSSCSSLCSSTAGEDLSELLESISYDMTLANISLIEFKAVLTELETAWSIEEKEILTRASYLQRETKQFSKMSQSCLKI